MKIVKFITYLEAEETGFKEHGLGGLGGFFENGMRWKEYLSQFFKEAHPELELLRSKILENGIRCTGAEHQNTVECVPLWKDNTVDTYSYRAWGDLMAAVWSTEEDTDYSYMDFYM